MACFLFFKILTWHIYPKHPIHFFSENSNLAPNPKNHPKWVKSRYFDGILMKYWLLNAIFTHKVGLSFNPFFFIDLVT